VRSKKNKRLAFGGGDADSTSKPNATTEGMRVHPKATSPLHVKKEKKKKYFSPESGESAKKERVPQRGLHRKTRRFGLGI